MLRKIPVENFAPLQQNRELTNVQVQIQCESQATRKWLEQNGRLRNMLVQSSVDPTPFELTNGKPLVILSLCGWRGDAAWQFVRQHDDCRSHCNDDDGIFAMRYEHSSKIFPPWHHLLVTVASFSSNICACTQSLHITMYGSCTLVLSEKTQQQRERHKSSWYENWLDPQRTINFHWYKQMQYLSEYHLISCTQIRATTKWQWS